MHTNILAFARRYSLRAFLAAAVLVGVFACRDYGISWDEPNMYRVGTQWFNTVFHGAAPPQEAAQRYYGTIFEILLHAAEEFWQLRDSQAVFALRRFLTYLSFVGGVAALFFLARRHFGDGRLGLAAAAMLFLSPRMFAHAFYNTRDIPGLVLFVLCAYTLMRLLDERNLRWALLHGLAVALLVSVRITGVLMAGFTGLFLLSQAWKEWRESGRAGETGRLAAAFAAAAAAGTVAFWPFLWNNPLGHFLEAYRWSADLPAGSFYLGKWMGGVAWHYIPVWVAVTTPPLYTFLFLAGCASLAVSLRRGRWRGEGAEEGRNWLLFFLWLLVPSVLVTVLNKGIHDEYRHLFFIYPAFLLVAAEGLRFLLRSFPLLLSERAAIHWRKAVMVAVALGFLRTGYWMARNHPFENLYFALPSSYIEGNFEADYWGLTFRRGFEYVLAHDPDATVAIHPTSSPGYSTLQVLSPGQRDRVRLVGKADAEYVLDNFQASGYRPTLPESQEIYAVEVDGLKALGVYKVK